MRHAMVRPGRDRLSGSIEVDETLVGGKTHDGKRGRGAEGKSLVAIAIEVHEPKGFGRVRMQRIPDASESSLIPFVCNSVEPGSTILTDSWRGYNALHKHGYTHRKVNLSDSDDPAHVVMPGVHIVSSLVKRWILGTLQGSLSDKHIDYYLDEYTFRFNRRTSNARGLLFYRLLQQAVMITPVTYRQIVRGPD
jgi:transposase-like protein